MHHEVIEGLRSVASQHACIDRDIVKWNIFDLIGNWKICACSSYEFGSILWFTGCIEMIRQYAYGWNSIASSSSLFDLTSLIRPSNICNPTSLSFHVRSIIEVMKSTSLLLLFQFPLASPHSSLRSIICNLTFLSNSYNGIFVKSDEHGVCHHASLSPLL